MLDVFYLTYGDDFSQDNFNRIQDKLGKGQRLHRVHGVPGIYNAHQVCAMASLTDHFYVIDGDAWLVDEFDLTYVPSEEIDVYPNVPQTQVVHVWRAYNPVIDETYGYGGVKLLHKDLFQEVDANVVDMTTTIANGNRPYWAVPTLSNETRFNTDPFSTFKGAFREVAKLTAGDLSKNVDPDTVKEKLKMWFNPNPESEYHIYAALGTASGYEYATLYGQDKDAMKKVNDFDWLKQVFDEQIKYSV